MNWEEYKRDFLTNEEREELARKTKEFNEEVKKHPWKHLRKPKRHRFGIHKECGHDRWK